MIENQLKLKNKLIRNKIKCKPWICALCVTQNWGWCWCTIGVWQYLLFSFSNVYYLNWPTRNEARFAEMGLLMVIGSKACGNWAGLGDIEGWVSLKCRILFLESKPALVFLPLLYAHGWEVYCLAWTKGQLASEHAIFSSTLHFCEIHCTLGTYNFFEHLTVLTVSFWRCKDPGKKISSIIEEFHKYATGIVRPIATGATST